MNMWEAIVVIVIVTSVARMVRAKYRLPDDRRGKRHQSFIAFQDNEAMQAENTALRRELAEVTERIKVLERIVTDGRQAQSIAAEIEALRDT